MFHVEQILFIMSKQVVRGRVVDIHTKKIFNGEILFENSVIKSITPINEPQKHFILPGFVDSHIHIESTMLTPSRFSRLIVPHGTIGVVTDPHEIANVLGVKGVEYMIQDASHVPVKIFFGAPSCVPATFFETSGAVLSSSEVDILLQRDDIWFLSEMMNFPGVINNDNEVHRKLKSARDYNKPIDGHAPGIKGEELSKYAAQGILTDHECATLEEALEKIEKGMKIQIREGSAARNFEALFSLIDSHPDSVMLCTDDIHTDELLKHGHINKLLKAGVKQELELFNLLRAATVVPVEHYNLPVGLLRVGDPADFILLEDLNDFKVLETWIDGEQVFSLDDGVKINLPKVEAINQFRTEKVSLEQLLIKLPADKDHVKVIDVVDGEITTRESIWSPKVNEERLIQSNSEEDVLKLVVINRYKPEMPSIGFVRNIGIKSGAFGGTVAHDSHNIIVVGVDDNSILEVINCLIEAKGGIVSYDDGQLNLLSLPVAGLMSLEDGQTVALQYQVLNDSVKHLGTILEEPFMTLSFLSLLVIPSLKLGDKGLFDVNKFQFTSLFV